MRQNCGRPFRPPAVRLGGRRSKLWRVVGLFGAPVPVLLGRDRLLTPAAGVASAPLRRHPGKTPFAGFWEAQLEVKKSRFVARLGPCSTLEDAREFRRRVADTQVSHNCWAAVLRDGRVHSSDDGEVSGTAGRPMRALLLGAAVCGVVVVVTRYYGGIKLGTGGLVRAYSAVCKAVLDLAEWVEAVEGVRLQISGLLPERVSALYHLVKSSDAEMLEDPTYDETARAHTVLWVPQTQVSEISSRLLDMNGADLDVTESPDIVAERPEKRARVRIVGQNDFNGLLGHLIEDSFSPLYPYKVELDNGRTRWFGEQEVAVIEDDSAQVEQDCQCAAQSSKASESERAGARTQSEMCSEQAQVIVRDTARSAELQRAHRCETKERVVFDLPRAEEPAMLVADRREAHAAVPPAALPGSSSPPTRKLRGLRGKLSRPPRRSTSTRSSLLQWRCPPMGAIGHERFVGGYLDSKRSLLRHGGRIAQCAIRSEVDHRDLHAAAVRRWLDTIVIGMGLCPWAGVADGRGDIRIVTTTAACENEVVTDLLAEARQLMLPGPPHGCDVQSAFRSTLLVCPFVNAWAGADSSNFVDFVVESLEESADFVVVAFHPHSATFDDGVDATDLLFRAPRPVLQLLRQTDLEKAHADFGTDEIKALLEQNRRQALALGRVGVDTLLRWCG